MVLDFIAKSLIYTMVLSMMGLLSKRFKQFVYISFCVFLGGICIVFNKTSGEITDFDFGLFICIVIVFDHIFSLIINKIATTNAKEE